MRVSIVALALARGCVDGGARSISTIRQPSPSCHAPRAVRRPASRSSTGMPGRSTTPRRSIAGAAVSAVRSSRAARPLRVEDAPALDDLVVLTWNAHLAEGRLSDLINQLRAGALTGGRPVQHFVLLLQELFRRGSDVPRFAGDVRSAYAIKARDPDSPDANQYAAGLGLSFIYVPSMRNGPELQEDRGNAIVSSEPLLDPVALELPFERQRRVAIGASVRVRTRAGIETLNVFNVHLEPLSSPSSLWIFRNPRRRQVASVLDLLRQPRFTRRRRHRARRRLQHHPGRRRRGRLPAGARLVDEPRRRRSARRPITWGGSTTCSSGSGSTSPRRRDWRSVSDRITIRSSAGSPQRSAASDRRTSRGVSDTPATRDTIRHA